jgi:hypothetical protein
MEGVVRVFTIAAVMFSLCVPTIINAEIIAYPVPFDPVRDTLTVRDEDGRFQTGDLDIDFSVCDINGDTVFRQTYSALPIRWKGYNDKGGRIAVGLYYVRVRVMDRATGMVKRNNIRILVKKK